MTQSVAEGVGGGVRGDAGWTLVDWFRLQVRTRADEPSMRFRTGGLWATITWGQFGQAARRIASMLLGEGVAEHDHVAIWSSNRPEWHIADAATLGLRARPVPVYLSLTSEQAAYVLGHSEARVAFVEGGEQLSKLLSVRDRLPKLQRVVVFDLPDGAGDPLVLSWQQALEQGDQALAERSAEIERRAAAVSLDDVATLIYTSGTTGPPKAVLLTHRNINAAHDCLAPLFPSYADDRVVSYLPLAHIAERMVSEFRSYRYGNPTWFLDSLPNLGEVLREVHPTVFFGVPRVWEKIAQRIQAGIAESPRRRRAIAGAAIATGRAVAARRERGEPIPWLLARRHALADRLVLARLRALIGLDQARVCSSGAAPISPDVLRFFAAIGIEILEVYGQSEDTAMTSINLPGESRIGTVGKPLPSIEVRIADDGEILVRGAPVFSGYYKDEAATREAVDADGWLHTGDVGELDADGYLRLTDRKKDLIITAGGKNISPGNIQEALKQHPLVGNALAIGDQRPYVTALLTLDPEEAPRWARDHGIDAGATLPEHPAIREELQRHVDSVNSGLSSVEQVKRFTVLPKDFEIGDELTPTMKLRRKVVLEKYHDAVEEMYARQR